MAVQLLFCRVLFVGFKMQLAASLCYSFLTFSMRYQVVQPYNSSDKATTGKNFRFILSQRSDFHMAANLSISVRAFLTSLALIEILQSGYRRFLAFLCETIFFFMKCIDSRSM